jgi:hypothetical protein
MADAGYYFLRDRVYFDSNSNLYKEQHNTKQKGTAMLRAIQTHTAHRVLLFLETPTNLNLVSLLKIFNYANKLYVCN